VVETKPSPQVKVRFRRALVFAAGVVRRPPLRELLGAVAHPNLAELEQIERSAWEDLARVAPPSLAAGIGLATRPIGGALFVMAAKIPQFQFNWLAGAGLGVDDAACIGEAVKRFRAAGQTRFIVQIPPGPNARKTESLARESGLQPSPPAWAKFHRETRNPAHVDTALAIREVGSRRARCRC
jgi:hypothetical protein